MPKNKRPVPRKSHKSPEKKDALTIKRLADLALELVEQEDSATLSAELAVKQVEFHRLINKLLNQNKDEVLYEAIEHASCEDADACQYLRRQIEESSSTVLVRRVDAPAMEINAFVIPLFVHSTGGLRQEEEFQDQDAFEALVASFGLAGLESPQAKVVLMRHAYDMNEMDRITYSHLNEMVRDALASMTDKKMPATPALERSLAGWAPRTFGADDAAIELRFLLGFALKPADDAFYQPPQEEAAADAYFDARMVRYEQWTSQAGALVQRCLATDGRALEINFLYQDLFHGGKEQGVDEYFMLQMMSEINHALEKAGITADQASAVMGMAASGDEMCLRVAVLGADGTVLATPERPLGPSSDMFYDLPDVADALRTLGITDLSETTLFDASGRPIDTIPFRRG